MTIPTIPQFTTPVPQSTDPKATFDPRADTMLGEFPPFVDATNTAITGINAAVDQVETDTATVVAAEAVAVAAANFEGAWASLTGALTVPASVSHAGSTWLLLDDLADVTTSEPSGANADWLRIYAVSSVGDGLVLDDADASVDIATDANLHSGAALKMVDAAGIYSANAPVTSSGSGAWSPNFDAGRKFVRTLTGNSTLGNPTNQAEGQEGVIFFKKASTFTLSLGSHWELPGGAPVLSAGSATDAISYYVETSGLIRGLFVGGWSE